MAPLISEPIQEPIQVFQWVLENLSPADVLRSSQVRNSFQKFLQRGTVSQLRQLQIKAQDRPGFMPSVSIHDGVTPKQRLGRTSIRASAINDCSRSLKRKQRSFDQLYQPRNVTKKSQTIGLSESSSPVPVPSSFASSSPASTNSAPDSDFSCPETPRDDSPYLASPQASSSHEALLSIEICEASHCDVISNAAKFFEARLGTRTKRLHYLVRAVQGFLEAPKLEPGFAKAMWCSRSSIFTRPEMADSNARLRNLYDGHRRIKQAREQYLYAARFCYIYLEHDLEELSKSHALVLSQGRGRMTAAFEVQAKIISTSVEVVKAERKAGRGYLQLLLEGGPGFILRLGCNVSTIWERKLSVSDISLIIEYLQTKTPTLYNDIKSHDRIATQALLEGFVAYGWTKDEILSSTSQLFDELKQYVNMDDFFHGEIMEETTPDLPDLTVTATHGTSPQGSYDKNLMPAAAEIDVCNSDTSFADFCLVAGEEELLCMQEFCPSYPEMATEIAEMSDAELESWMSLGATDLNQNDEIMVIENDNELLIWDGCFDRHNSDFSDASFMIDSFDTHR
ncbi:uncharacterized protein RAG0_01749 [Rhynchosporium agropyri]|uniref:Uncharacterized protein n=1 Tax=Rhynchosporium agropyri TaxID=914238 RepID=A0A1E1JYR4_9HELO|nr:uncharacterized protein RAG0_01749 [Rhynchosporium agropyri]